MIGEFEIGEIRVLIFGGDPVECPVTGIPLPVTETLKVPPPEGSNNLPYTVHKRYKLIY